MARQFLCDASTTVQTKAGKLRGFQLDGTYIFQGIKYADAKRFQAPVPVKPWDGVKDALSYGYVCPLMNQDVPNGELMVPHRYWPMDENCQYLNIWTGSLDPEAKKPVMVWLHGGGFFAGSSIEQVAYDGTNLCQTGDVVVVSLNHRLNILGYLNLSDYSEKYARSANAGTADMVEALRWIRDNIARFGGDPDNVTLFGQSGGGMKVTVLMQTPEADGLFHKGIIQSGVLDEFGNPEKTDAAPLVEALLEELGLSVSEIEQLETIPYVDLAKAYNKVAPALDKAGEYVGTSPLADDYYVGDPREVGFRDHAKTIPLMIGTVFGEFAFGPGVENKDQLPQSQIMAMLEKKYGDYGSKLVPLFKKAYPDKNLCDLLVLDGLFRVPTADYVAKRSVYNEAPVYSYLFAYEFPLEGGKPAWHCSEIPFVFHNTDKVAVCNIPGVSDRLEERMSGAWVAFARYGNPNIPALPCWPASTPGDEATMIFDRSCKVAHNYDHELLEMLMEAGPCMPVFEEPDEDAIILH
ncbi:MAG TPA: carboxylesterase/lipase family protein [Candidatus Scybalocola faecigallinarum]|uniref:Carboxylic ester hydrolase n=1 Tax=Candidatus Scybalocola faecigallinarum TaxID=2840941 RepID=A0A9D1JQS0_9FIRM|nr:carboxylesterase/lipase family protein [Candidatus Scybalocola faecigallinarum]